MPQDRKVWAASRLASETMIGSAGNVRSAEASSDGEDWTTRMAMSSSMSPGTAYFGRRGHRVGVPAGGGRAHRVLQHLDRLGLGVVTRAVGTGPPVGQAVGVEHQDGAGRHADRLLPVGRAAP
jgi:hypothetical protein